MKRLFLLFIFASLSGAAAPDLTTVVIFSNRPAVAPNGTTIFAPGPSSPIVNIQRGCVTWQLTYAAEGFTALSLTIQQARVLIQNNNPGPANTWNTFTGTNSVGAIPLTSPEQGFYTARNFYPFVRLNLISFTGIGTVVATLSCWTNINYAIDPNSNPLEFDFRRVNQVTVKTESQKVSL